MLKLASAVVTIVAVRMASSRLTGSSRADPIRRSRNAVRAPCTLSPGPAWAGGVYTSLPRLRPMLPTLRNRSRGAGCWAGNGYLFGA